MEWGLPDQVREADRDQEEDEATAGEWEEAEQLPVPEENAYALPAEPQQHTRPESRVISRSVPSAGQVWRGSRAAHFMVISIASGKEGTGKTNVAVSLAGSAGACQFLDCDVEERRVSDAR